MKYVYNAERDRIAGKAWDPTFFLAIYEEQESKEQRALYLHATAGVNRHLTTLAEKYMNEDETLVSVKIIPRKQYENWLYNNDFVLINNINIPISFIVDYLIAEDNPQGMKENEGISPKYGDLSIERNLLKSMDENLLQKIYESYDKASEKNDFVREAPEVESDPLYDAYNAIKDY